MKIFHNKFKPINLYRLRHMQGLWFESYRDHDRIGIEDGMLLLRKNSGTYKDFGKSFYEVWSEAFITYTSIIVFLFGATAPDLHSIITIFSTKILQLAKVYEWQEAVLPLAIDPTKWVIPSEFQARFCTPMTQLGMITHQPQAKRKRSRSPHCRRVAKQPGGVSHNPSVTCESFNRGSCTWPGCERAHKCKGCGSQEHGLASCPKGKLGGKA